METNAENTAPVEAPKVDSEGTETPSVGSAPTGTEAAASGELPPGFENWTIKAQERYHELTRDKYGLQSERDIERHMRQHYERENAELRAKLTPAKTEPVAPEQLPTLESVEYDETKFVTAISEHFTKVAKEQGKAAAQEAFQEYLASQGQERSQNEWRKRADEFAKSNPAFLDKVIKAPSLPFSEDVARTLMQLEEGPAIALHLVENRDKADAIMRLAPQFQMMELGRIQAELSARKVAKPPVSQAPPPPPKIDAGEASSEVDQDKMTTEQWMKWERKRMAKATKAKFGG